MSNDVLAADDGVPSTLRIGEIVLKTGHYERMRAWYRAVLGIGPTVEHVRDEKNGRFAPFSRMCFFRLHLDHPQQEMIVLFEVPATGGGNSADAGLHHMQLRDDSVVSLCRRYRRLRRDEVIPQRAMDHGPSTSLYYRDPDGNVVELAASNFTSSADMLASFETEAWLANPAGVAVDPEALAVRLLD
jgi:catechol-2,3-dioxygenase